MEEVSAARRMYRGRARSFSPYLNNAFLSVLGCSQSTGKKKGRERAHQMILYLVVVGHQQHAQ